MKELQVGESIEFVKRLNPARGNALEVYERTARIAHHVTERLIAKYDPRSHSIITIIELHNGANGTAEALRVRATIHRTR